MPKCVTIIPGVCHNDVCCLFNKVTMRTHNATCDSEFHFIDHHAITDEHRHNSLMWKQEVEAHGGFYHYADGPFNVARYCNIGINTTDSEYFVIGSADLIFYPGWLDWLYIGWERNKHFHSIHPRSYSKQSGLCFQPTPELQDICVECDHPAGWVGLYKRSNPYRPDETIRFWENDTNYWYWLKQQKRVAGVCMASRVDNLEAGIRNWCDPRCYDGYAPEQDCEALKKKWTVIPEPVVTGTPTS